MERLDSQIHLTNALPPVSQPLTSRGKRKTLNHLEMLLDYELRGAVRYRRFATLVLISVGVEQVDLRALLNESIRASDEVFDLNPTVAILMGETDSAGALTAVSRFKSMCKSEADLRFALASFPADSRGTAELLWTAHRRLDEAREREMGAVVSSG